MASHLKSHARITLLATAVCSLRSAAGLAHAAEGAGWQVNHFDTPRPLTLNTDRIAVEFINPPGLTGPRGGNGGSPIAGAAVVQAEIPGWWFLDLPPAQRSAADIEALVDQVVTDANVRFATPVFVDDLGGPMFPTRDVLVRFNASVPAPQKNQVLAAAPQLQIVEADWAGMNGAYRLRHASGSGVDVIEKANEMALRPEMLWAEPDMVFTGTSGLIPNDTGFGSCWGLHNTGQSGGTADVDMDGPEAWDLTVGNASIIAVVIDSGVTQTHPDVNQIPGTDTTSEGPGSGGPVNACDKHGTAVAGCISGTINNSLGTVGIAPGCVTASARTFISSGACNGSWSSQASWTVDTLAWAESIGARVTNNSNGYGFSSSAIADKYADTRTNGMVHFASAGNNASAGMGYPASLSSVNAVAAIDRNGNLASFSNYGGGLAFSAPGVAIYTTDQTGAAGYSSGDYTTVNGTSFSSPYTAGVAALLLAWNSQLTAAQVEQTLQLSATDLGAAGYDTTFGWGLVNAAQAIASTSAGDAVGACCVYSSVCELRTEADCDLQGGAYQGDGSSCVPNPCPTGCAPPIGKLADPAAAAGDRFGAAVAISGETILVGAANVDNHASTIGSAHVFVRVAADWVQQQELSGAGATIGERYGHSVAIDGDTAVVGAPNDNGGVGAVHVFTRTSGVWTLQQTLTPAGGASGDLFGWSVAISTDTIVVGAPHRDSPGANQGAGYVFFRTGGSWNPQGVLTGNDSAAGDLFGWSVDVHLDTAVVGAKDDNGAIGSAYVFVRNAGSWSQQQKLTASDGIAGDEIGHAVAVDGDTVLVAGDWQSPPTTERGAV